MKLPELFSRSCRSASNKPRSGTRPGRDEVHRKFLCLPAINADGRGSRAMVLNCTWRRSSRRSVWPYYPEPVDAGNVLLPYTEARSACAADARRRGGRRHQEGAGIRPALRRHRRVRCRAKAARRVTLPAAGAVAGKKAVTDASQEAFAGCVHGRRRHDPVQRMLATNFKTQVRDHWRAGTHSNAHGPKRIPAHPDSQEGDGHDRTAAGDALPAG